MATRLQHDPQTLPQMLRQLRTQAGMTQKQLGLQSGISRSVIAQLELYPDRWMIVADETLRALAQALTVDVALFSQIRDSIPIPNNQPEDTLSRNGTGTNLSNYANMILASPTLAMDDDVTVPITDQLDKPAAYHQQEDLNQRGLCLLEAERRSYLTWLDLPTEDQTLGTLGAILSAEDGMLAKWAHKHNIPDDRTGDTAILGTRTPVYQADSRKANGFAPVSLNLDARAQIRTQDTTMADPLQKRIFRLDSTSGRQKLFGQVDHLAITDGTQAYDVYVPCPHETESDQPDDHPWKIDGQGVRQTGNPSAKATVTGTR
ncbi:MAG: helix-turn-helix domain-containing protein [Sulfobacillus sp.]